MKLYLALSALLYIVLGVWCLADPLGTSTYLGFALISPDGFSEFMAVYGGMELAFGVFYVLALARPSLREAAVVFSVCLYGGIASLRLASAAMYTLDHALPTMVLECLLLLWALLLLLWPKRNDKTHRPSA